MYTNNGKSEREIKESIPFTIATKRIKYLALNLPKETKKLYTENDKTLIKDQRWHKQMENMLCSLAGKINIVKMAILPDVIYRFSVIPIKLPMAFFTELKQKILQFIWKHRKPHIAKAVLWKKNGAGGINLPDFRLYYKDTVIKIVRCWHKNRNIDQWKKTESPEINPCTYRYISFDREGKNIQWG